MKIEYDGLLFVYKEKINIFVLIILIVLRLVSGVLTEKVLMDYSSFYQILITLPLLIFVIWINQNSLHFLQIDRPLIFLFGLASFLLCFYFWNTVLEIALIASLLFFFRFLFDKNVIFERETSFLKKETFLYIVLGLTPIILLGTVFGVFSFSQSFLTLGIAETIWIISMRLWNAIYEVVLFWGILWMVLKGLKINNIGTIFIAAVLFWLAHINLFPSKTFWVTMPALGFWLGYLSLRSKSLMPATITYFTYNMVASILQLAINSPS